MRTLQILGQPLRRFKLPQNRKEIPLFDVENPSTGFLWIVDTPQPVDYTP